MDVLALLKSWFDKNKKEIEKDYFSFLRFQSISADPSKKEDCRACAKWLSDWMKNAKIHSELVETPGLPFVYGEIKGSKEKTLLIYGHYDVQPIDPIDHWKSPPFEPTEKDGSIFARGAVDDKGQIFYALVALKAMIDLKIPLSCNIKVCVEGEEESASTGLFLALQEKKIQEKLEADELLIVDFDQFSKDIPAISLGGRGIVALEVKIRGSKIDMHSGLCGGIAYNPNRALVEMLSKLWDEKGKVQIPKFYDDVLVPTEEEKKFYSFPHDESYFEKEFGLHAKGGESEKSIQESNWFRPTVEINGIGGGYVGAGVKTVIPEIAEARITCRLVPHQKPEEIVKELTAFLKDHLPKGLELTVIPHKGMPAFRGSPDSNLAKNVAKAATEVTKESCRYMLGGGSIPIVAVFIDALKVEVVGMGYGLLSDKIHAPNEHFDMHRFEQGFLTVGRAISFYEKK